MNEVKARILIQKRCSGCSQFLREGSWYSCCNYETNTLISARTASAFVENLSFCDHILKKITPICKILGITNYDEK